MLKKILLLTVLVFTGVVFSAEAPQMTVKGDERVELLSLVFKLAGNPEYGRCGLAGYDKETKKQFEPFADHPVVRMAKELRSSRGVSFDAVMSMAIHLDNALDCNLIVPAEQAKNLDGRWPRERIPEFLNHLRDFSEKSSFLDFYGRHEALYEKHERQIGGVVDKLEIIPWVSRNFSRSGVEAFQVVPAFLNGPNNYGPKTEYEGKNVCYAIIGVSGGMDGKRLEELLLYLAVHEFLHSFANPLVDENYSELKKPAEQLYTLVGPEMKRMAYGNAQTMMYETFVRAATCLYLWDKQGEKAADALAAQEHKQSFYLVPPLYKRMVAERRKAGEGWTVEKGLPAYRETIDAYLESDEYKKLVDKQKDDKKFRPKIVRLSPANGAKNVDPGITEITIRFSRKMRAGSWAFCQADPAKFPEIGTIRYDRSGMVLTAEVKLEPEKDYLIFFNAPGFDGFASAEGSPLESYRYTFRTGKKRD